MLGIDLMQGRKKVEEVSGGEHVDKTQGSQRVQECVVKTRANSGWSQRVQDWTWVLGNGSDDLGMT